MNIRAQPMWRHLSSYGSLASWLISKAASWFGWRLALGVALSIGSVAVEMLAFYLVVQVIHAFEVTGTPLHSSNASMDWLLGLPHAALIALPTLALLLSGFLTYLGRSNAITVQGRYVKRLGDEIIAVLTSKLSFYDRLSLPFGLKADDVVLALTNDIASCGMAIRLCMLHVISIVYVFVGFGILGVLAPALLLLWMLALVVIAPLIYLINLQALSEARLLWDVGPAYRRSFHAHVRALVSARFKNVPLNEELRQRHFSIMGHRLRVIELSRLTMNTVFALAIAMFLWIAQRPEAKEMFNFGYLLFLFLAFRYTYSGFQGISVLVTTINRNLPALMRVYSVERRVAQLARRRQADAVSATSLGPRPTSFPWSVRYDGTATSGTFRPGQAHALVIPGRANIADIQQVLLLLSGRPARNAFIQLAGEQPEILDGTAATEGAADLTAEERDWLSAQLKARSPATPSAMGNGDDADLDDAHEPRERQTLAFLKAVVVRARDEPGVVLLDGNKITELNFQAQRQILEKLSKHLVFALGNRIGPLLLRHPFDHLFISSGDRIELALGQTDTITTEQKAKAKQAFGHKQSEEQAKRADAAPLDEIDEELF